MNQKRGVTLLVFFLLVFFLLSFSVKAEVPGLEEGQKVPALGWKGELPYTTTPPCAHGSGRDCSYDSTLGSYLKGGENIEIIDNDKRVGITVGPTEGDYGEPSLSRIIQKPDASEHRCAIAFIDHEISGENNVGGYTVHAGAIINTNYENIDLFTNEDFQFALEGFFGSEIIHGLLHGARFRSNGVQDYFCAADSYWHICQDDKDKIDKIKKDDGTTVDDYSEVTYYGSLAHANDKVYNCTDFDYDLNKLSADEAVTWRELPGFDKDNDGFTDKMGDCRDDPTNDPLVCEDLESSEDCSNIKYSACAICINPDQTEIGGDGIDNSCRTDETEDAVLNVDDDMDQKEYKEVCLGKQSNSEHRYDFLESKEGNSCCGDDGIDDLGSIIDPNSGKFICLTSEKDFVSLQIGGKEVNSLEDWGDKTWKWVSPSVNTKFTILTINKPGEKSYDVVSNGLDWKACSQGKEGILESSQFEVFGSGDKYRCLATENQNIWAECCKEGVSCQSASGAGGIKVDNINGIKIRHPGQGLFDLLPFLKDNSIHFSSLGSSTAYADIYGKRYPSFADFAYLDIYFQFSDETIPADVSLQLEVFSPSGKIASENVLSHIVNGAAIEGKRTYHARIPISGWRDVILLSFVASPKEVKIEFKDIHAAKEGDDPVCSSDSAWLESLDSPSSGVEPGKMCEDLGLQWLGEKAAEPALRCCGNTAGEYGIGDGKGCWNSQGIKAGETANNVKVELTYGKGELEYSAAEIEVSAMLSKTSYGKVDILGDLAYSNCKLVGSKIICPENEFDSNVKYSEKPHIDVEGKYTGPGSTLIYGATSSAEETSITGTLTSSEPKKIKEVTFTKTNFIEASLQKIQGGKVYFFDPLKDDQYSYDDEKTTIKYEDLEQEKTTYYIMAEADTLKQSYSYLPKITETLTYSCRFDSSQPACTFPLKGSAPYAIKNLFPQKYDLYFVAKTVEGQEIRTFINPEKTIYAPNGWLEAVNLQKQVLFDGKAFMGCGDTTPLEETPLAAEKFCSAKKLETSGFYCSPEGSWKNDELTVTGYDVNNNIQFLPDASPQKPEERTHLSSIVFGRNLLINPMLDLTK